VLASDPLFSSKMTRFGAQTMRNRKGVKKTYSNMTVGLVQRLAKKGVDAVNLHRDELIAEAFMCYEIGSKIVV
jgi:hypothetical protein